MVDIFDAMLSPFSFVFHVSAYIIIESNTETRFFGGTNTLFQGDGEKRFTIIDRVLEPELFTHLKMTNEVEEKA